MNPVGVLTSGRAAIVALHTLLFAGGVQRALTQLIAQSLMRKLAQMVVNDRNQLVQCLRIASGPALDQIGNVDGMG